MKAALAILYASRKGLVEEIKEKTLNAKYYSSEVQAHQEKSRRHQAAAEAVEKNLLTSCLARNEAQAQLNQIDAAIAKLEQE